MLSIYCSHISLQISQKTSHSSPVSMQYGVSFVNSKSGCWSCVNVTVDLWVLSCYKWPRVYSTEGLHTPAYIPASAGHFLGSFCVASVCLAINMRSSWQLSDKLGVGSSLAPDVFSIFTQFPKDFSNILQDDYNAKAFSIDCGKRRSIKEMQDVRTMSRQQCRQVAKAVNRFIFASQICPGSKSLPFALS